MTYARTYGTLAEWLTLCDPFHHWVNRHCGIYLIQCAIDCHRLTRGAHDEI